MSGGGQNSGGYGGGSYGAGPQQPSWGQPQQNAWGGNGGFTKQNPDPNAGGYGEIARGGFGTGWGGGANPPNNPGVSPGRIPGGGFGVNPGDPGYDGGGVGWPGKFPPPPPPPVGDPGTDQAFDPYASWAGPHPGAGVNPSQTAPPQGASPNWMRMYAQAHPGWNPNAPAPDVRPPGMVGPPAINPSAGPMQGRGAVTQQPTGFQDWRSRRAAMGI